MFLHYLLGANCILKLGNTWSGVHLGSFVQMQIFHMEVTLASQGLTADNLKHLTELLLQIVTLHVRRFSRNSKSSDGGCYSKLSSDCSVLMVGTLPGMYRYRC